MREKILIVIPAYNESANIVKVLSDIKHEIKNADVLVVNDCSTDDTATIVRQHGVKCISTVYNMGYAMAIQTGLKYAKDNGYSYVIQMDADGQHLASEAEKLFTECKRLNADIIIGSRYIKDMGYRSPFFRRFGTKIFELMIRLFCHQKITDPLAGFQCLNKKVIDHYAACGNYPEYPDANLIIEMLMNGYKISEVPVKMKNRKEGVSMHSGIWKPTKYMTTQFYACIVLFIKNIWRRRAK